MGNSISSYSNVSGAVIIRLISQYVATFHFFRRAMVLHSFQLALDWFFVLQEEISVFRVWQDPELSRFEGNIYL